MTMWHPETPAWYRDTAERVCTTKQLEVLRLATLRTRNGKPLSDRNIGRILGVSRETIRGHREAAYRRMSHALKETAA